MCSSVNTHYNFLCKADEWPGKIISCYRFRVGLQFSELAVGKISVRLKLCWNSQGKKCNFWSLHALSIVSTVKFNSVQFDLQFFWAGSHEVLRVWQICINLQLRIFTFTPELWLKGQSTCSTNWFSATKDGIYAMPNLIMKIYLLSSEKVVKCWKSCELFKYVVFQGLHL